LSKQKNRKVRIYLPFFILFLAFFIIETRLYNLQIIKHKELTQQVRKNQIKRVDILPERGIIYDRNLEKLAINIPSYSLYACPKKISHPEKLAEQLSSILGIKSSSLLAQLKKKKVFLWLKRKLPLAKKEEIKSLHLEGIGFIEESERFYPQKELASHILGFTGIDNQGLAGVELYYERELRGEKGHFWIREDALGYEIPLTRRVLQNLVPGKDIVLTIDNIIQSIVEQEISLTLRKTKAKSVEAIFMDPRTGEILALANKPDYDPNRYADYSSFSRKNRVVQSIYEPGSTFKPITASVILEEKLVTAGESIYCQGSIKIANHTFHDWKAFNRNLTLAEILENSSSIGMIKLASRMSEKLFSKYIKLFGFGQRTGIDLPGEAKGIVRASSLWSLTDLPAISIGQAIAVTPLQMISAFCALINEGKLLRPYLVKYVCDSEGKIIKENKPTMVRKVISSSTSAQIRKLLEQVVEKGTGKRAKVRGYSIGGKTGTAQIPAPTGKGYLPNKYISSFMGFAPVASPRIAGIVIIKEPTGAYYGGEIAAPLFARIMKRVLPYLDVLPEKEEWVKIEISQKLRGKYYAP